MLVSLKSLVPETMIERQDDDTAAIYQIGIITNHRLRLVEVVCVRAVLVSLYMYMSL